MSTDGAVVYYHHATSIYIIPRHAYSNDEVHHKVITTRGPLDSRWQQELFVNDIIRIVEPGVDMLHKYQATTMLQCVSEVVIVSTAPFREILSIFQNCELLTFRCLHYCSWYDGRSLWCAT